MKGSLPLFTNVSKLNTNVGMHTYLFTFETIDVEKFENSSTICGTTFDITSKKIVRVSLSLFDHAEVETEADLDKIFFNVNVLTSSKCKKWKMFSYKEFTALLQKIVCVINNLKEGETFSLESMLNDQQQHGEKEMEICGGNGGDGKMDVDSDLANSIIVHTLNSSQQKNNGIDFSHMEVNTLTFFKKSPYSSEMEELAIYLFAKDFLKELDKNESLKNEWGIHIQQKYKGEEEMLMVPILVPQDFAPKKTSLSANPKNLRVTDGPTVRASVSEKVAAQSKNKMPAFLLNNNVNAPTSDKIDSNNVLAVVKKEVDEQTKDFDTISELWGNIPFCRDLSLLSSFSSVTKKSGVPAISLPSYFSIEFHSIFTKRFRTDYLTRSYFIFQKMEHFIKGECSPSFSLTASTTDKEKEDEEDEDEEQIRELKLLIQAWQIPSKIIGGDHLENKCTDQIISCPPFVKKLQLPETISQYTTKDIKSIASGVVKMVNVCNTLEAFKDIKNLALVKVYSSLYSGGNSNGGLLKKGSKNQKVLAPPKNYTEMAIRLAYSLAEKNDNGKNNSSQLEVKKAMLDFVHPYDVPVEQWTQEEGRLFKKYISVYDIFRNSKHLMINLVDIKRYKLKKGVTDSPYILYECEWQASSLPVSTPSDDEDVPSLATNSTIPHSTVLFWIESSFLQGYPNFVDIINSKGFNPIKVICIWKKILINTSFRDSYDSSPNYTRSDGGVGYSKPKEIVDMEKVMQEPKNINDWIPTPSSYKPTPQSGSTPQRGSTYSSSSIAAVNNPPAAYHNLHLKRKI